MANLNVVVLGSPEFAKDLGKKGTVSDMTFYNLKKGENTVTFIEPTRYPDRLAPLCFAVSLAQKALLVVEEINSAFGESVIMLDCAGLKSGLIVLRNHLSQEQLTPLIKGTAAENYEFAEDDKIALRARFLEEVARMGDLGETGTGTMPVDHCFNVRGVGTVALGCVAEGTIKRHDELRVLPGEGVAQVRSLQKHDQDCELSSAGDRVGLALKGVEVKDLDRGAILSSDSSVKSTSSLTARAQVVKYWPAPLQEGMMVHISHWMQFLPARVEAAKSNGDWHQVELTLKLEKSLVYKPGSQAVLTYPEGSKLRVIGALELS
jgi:selenocysteine-specific translation elongation factor